MSNCKITKEKMGRGQVIHVELTLALREDELEITKETVDKVAASITAHCTRQISKAIGPALLKRAK